MSDAANNTGLFGVHGMALELRSQRMGLLASNIANAATPGYKAKDIDFSKALAAEGTMVNVTLCFSAAQALLAAKAGATFISPFVGRLDDIGQDGMHLIDEIMTIYRQYPSFKTEVLVASVRHTQHVVAAAKLGAHVATVPPNVLRQLFKHVLTDNGLKAFLDDWAKTGQTIL